MISASPMIGCERRSKAVNVDDGLRECLRSFLRQIVPDTTLDEPVFIFAREFLAIRTIVRIMWCTVGITLKGNGGHGDDRTCGNSLFKIVILRLAIGQAEPPSVIVDHDADVIWVVERCSGAIECRITEIPFR